jgi:hypothetical protein
MANLLLVHTMDSDFQRLGKVNSPSRITLENNEKIRPQPDRENAIVEASGGETDRRIYPSSI